MLSVEKLPKEFVMAGQTIPFIVSTDIFDTNFNFDPIESSFKYLFELKTLRDDGTYRTFATAAIPPRPDNLVGFFDPSKLIQSAIAYDNGTHKINTVSPMPFSIVQFRMFCTERYLDNNGDFVDGDRIDLGFFYAIDGATTEGIDPYLIVTTGTTKDAMHHHELLGDQFVLRPNEPLTVSFLAKPAIEGSVLDEVHGDYGSFDYGDVASYTGITASTGVTLSKSTRIVLSGSALAAGINAGKFLTSSTSGEILRFTDFTLNPNSEYEFSIYARFVANFFSFLPSANAKYQAVAVGTGISAITLSIEPVIRNSRFTFLKIVLRFTTGSTIAGTEYIRINAISTITNDLVRLNQRTIVFDTAILKELIGAQNDINSARVIVNDGLSSEVTHVFPASYLADVYPFDEISKSRIDCPIGANVIYDVTGNTQDPTTGLWLDDNGDIGKYFHFELTNDTVSPAEVVASSETVYQISECDRYNNVRLKWLNNLGAWDYYTFDKVSVASTIVDRENYKITYGKIYKPDGVDEFDYIEEDTSRGYKSLTVLADDYVVINSDWVQNETGKFLRGILTSPEVYILNPEPYIEVPVTNEYELEYPVIIEDSEFEFRNNSSEAKLVNATFRIKIAVPFNNRTTNTE